MQYVFISYVHENREVVDRLQEELESYGIKIWRDLQDLNPGGRWKREIREAIQRGGFFIACFSTEYHERERTYMNDELTVAIEELRQLPIDRIWFIPVKLDDCEVPNITIGANETLEDLNYVNLYEDWDSNIQRIAGVIQSESIPEPSIELASQLPNISIQTEADEAIAAYTETINLNSSHANAYKQRGILYLLQGRYEQALADYDKLIELVLSQVYLDS